ncbi:helix-turn-helix transcriptional regulator [uncultured Cedecea sp.]|uniref:helix-turn-helix domain-containing protein n=1 Tax=uncultured Cedecea sp. TaxID=988762 RepID=UPI00261EFF9C|nr:helix-turn-helix transcriptional regulator [uncultured Cedecea sp.]
MNDRQIIDDRLNMLMSSYFKSKRLERGLTGKQMGKLLCVSQQQISRYERGETVIPLSFMVFFLNSYAFNLNDFFDYISNGIAARYNLEVDDDYPCLNTGLPPYARM